MKDIIIIVIVGVCICLSFALGAFIAKDNVKSELYGKYCECTYLPKTKGKK